MNTTAKVHSSAFSEKTEINKNQSENNFWEKAEFNRFGIIPILLVIVGCMGGFGASYGAGESTIKLAMVAFPSIIALALMLAVAPMRAIIWSSVIAVVLDILVLIF